MKMGTFPTRKKQGIHRQKDDKTPTGMLIERSYFTEIPCLFQLKLKCFLPSRIF